MSEPYIIEDDGTGYPTIYDPAIRMNYIASRETGRRWTFPPDAPEKYRVTCLLSARANCCLPRGVKTSLSRDGSTLVLHAPDRPSKGVSVDDPERFREACAYLRGPAF